MRKRNLEIILFVVNIIYMILELIASRILSPYFGSSNLVWTSIIGIILLSTSIGNYLGGIIADKNKESLKNSIIIILIIISILIFLIPLTQQLFIEVIIMIIKEMKIGAIIATTFLFFLPAMFIGTLSPIIIKMKINELTSVGKTSGSIYALATLGSIIGTFFGGFFLIPNFGSKQILFVLSMITLLLITLLCDKSIFKKISIVIIAGLLANISCLIYFYNINEINGKKILKGETNVSVEYDTQYGKVKIYNIDGKEGKTRHLNIDRGNESGEYIEENKKYDLLYEYTRYYDLMFNSSKEIKNVLMIGGAGYSYPKYYISKYQDKNMDVVEIDGKITEIAKKYFGLEELIQKYNIEQTKRLNLITKDGRIYLNNNIKKYDAILNDSFSGNTPAQTLTTKEAITKIYNSLNRNGIYLTNVISSQEGENSKFIKAEVKTLKQIFKNVYIVPCFKKEDSQVIQNNMVIATDEDLDIKETVNINIDEGVLLTDDFCPVDTLIPWLER